MDPCFNHPSGELTAESIECPILLPEVVIQDLPLLTTIIPIEKTEGQFLLVGVSSRFEKSLSCDLRTVSAFY